MAFAQLEKSQCNAYNATLWVTVKLLAHEQGCCVRLDSSIGRNYGMPTAIQSHQCNCPRERECSNYVSDWTYPAGLTASW
eukprot:scaffold533048_cov48-Prasinocladus_malaysianus.AAC.1